MSLRVPVHYDLASTLCYVAHRTLPHLSETLDELEIELVWSPLDLARLLGWQRGAVVAGRRRTNALAIAEEFGVRVRMPSHWIDSRRALAFGLAQREPAVAASWRERVFSAVFEEGRTIEHDEQLAPLARDLGLTLDPDAIEAGLGELARRTEAARDSEVTGVPTFQLGAWPLGGIQSDDTMRAILGQWADRQRRPR
jgi:predicted DsbA family dithiol-disulfide isomerase